MPWIDANLFSCLPNRPVDSGLPVLAAGGGGPRACVRACMRACVRVRVCVRACVIKFLLSIVRGHQVRMTKIQLLSIHYKLLNSTMH